MHTVTKSYHLSAAHRLEGHPKCGRLHGHNYRVEFTFTIKDLNTEGMVIDFGHINNMVGKYIDYFDHRYIVSYQNSRANCPYLEAAPENDFRNLPRESSTAENLASWYYEMISQELVGSRWYGVEIVEVTVWETPKAYATFKL